MRNYAIKPDIMNIMGYTPESNQHFNFDSQPDTETKRRSPWAKVRKFFKKAGDFIKAAGPYVVTFIGVITPLINGIARLRESKKHTYGRCMA